MTFLLKLPPQRPHPTAVIETNNPTRPYDRERLARIYEAQSFFAANRRSNQIQQQRYNPYNDEGQEALQLIILETQRKKAAAAALAAWPVKGEQEVKKQ